MKANLMSYQPPAAGYTSSNQIQDYKRTHVCCNWVVMTYCETPTVWILYTV